MIKLLSTITVLFICSYGLAQPNCTILKDSICIKACEIATTDHPGFQGSRESQEAFDFAIELCPTFAYAYYEKSVPYLKQGLIKEWKSHMDKAVELDPSYLLERGCNQILFIRNYEEGVKDLDRLVALWKTIDTGFSPSGEYHAQLLRAICYQKMGDLEKAIQLSKELTELKSYYQHPFDYFHIGVINLEAGNMSEAKAAFAKQNEYDEKAENHYYLSKVYKEEGDIAKQKAALERAKKLYESDQTMTRHYYHYIDKVFLSDIERELAKFKK